MENFNEELILIDGNSLLNRAYYGVPPLTTKEGVPVGAVYGFTNMLIKLIESHRPHYIAVAFDLKAKTFRHLAYSGYKATRHGMPDDLASQLPILKSLLKKMGIRIIEQEGIEADDILGTMAKNCGIKSYIVTGDRDSFQLIDDNITVLFTKRGITEIDEMTPSRLFESMKLMPSQIIDYKALAGDSSDNIPGVLGVGEKTAINLLLSYNNLNGVYSHIDEIKGALKEKLINGKESSQLSYFLATIKTDCDIDKSLNACEYNFPFNGDVFSEFIKLEFKTLIKRSQLFTETGSIAKEIIKPTSIEITSTGMLEIALRSVNDVLALELKPDISFTSDGVIQYNIPASEMLFDNYLTEEEIMLGLKEVIENSNVKKLVYDKKRFLHLTKIYGIKPANIEDVALLDYLVKRSFKYSNSAALAEDYMIEKSFTSIALFYEYKDAIKTLNEYGMRSLYYDIELPLEDVLFDMEVAGFKLDQDKLAELDKKYSSELNELQKSIWSLAGHNFNVNSPKQLAEVLFDELKLYNPNNGNQKSTAAEILEKIENDHPIVPKLLRYRFISKLKSTYIEGLAKVIDSSGFVHTEFNQMLTTTGRLSSSNPNLQNLPVREEEGKVLRELFVPSKNNVLVSADYSQIELRIMAHLSEDDNLVKAYSEGVDIHSAVAKELFGKAGSIERRIAKTVNFGIIYGISAFGLSESLKITPTQAKQYIDKYFEKYPKVKAYTSEAVNNARSKGYGESILGRRRVIPELMSPKFSERSFGERAAMNMPLQASAADIIKLAMIRVSNALKGKQSKLILQIHDELVIDTVPSELEEVKLLIKNEMENAIKLIVPLVVDVSYGNNLAECK